MGGDYPNSQLSINRRQNDESFDDSSYLRKPVQWLLLVAATVLEFQPQLCFCSCLKSGRWFCSDKICFPATKPPPSVAAASLLQLLHLLKRPVASKRQVCCSFARAKVTRCVKASSLLLLRSCKYLILQKREVAANI